ncbi:hypothetical protein DL96DRAFT_1706325 [Flagelloscypha sp. PMI_526]|nr:hypothetical protein DL96DRAFT_1706325 [Flagelloscypha sp. PMI_526]
MATPVLPDELWILVLDTVSQRTLRAFMQVNRVFYQAGRGVYLNRKLLNLAPMTDVIDTRLELVRDRLARAREYTTTLSSIKVLRITPHLYKPPIRKFTPDRLGWRVIQSPTVLPPISLASQAEEPHLSNLLTHPHFNRSSQLGTWSEFGSRLTSLSIQIMDREGLHRYLPRTHSFALPELTSFRLPIPAGLFTLGSAVPQSSTSLRVYARAWILPRYLNFTLISAVVDNPATLFTGLSEGGAIKVLELTGYSSLKPQHLFLLLQKMDNLATLYLPMSASTFSLNALAVLAEKVPELQKLVLTLDDPIFATALLHLTPVSQHAVLGRWKLQDFGILSSGVHPRRFEKVLNALVRVIPSISSFYGSGLQRVPSKGRAVLTSATNFLDSQPPPSSTLANVRLNERMLPSYDLFVSGCLQVSALVVLYWDHALTFPDEVQFIWQQPFSLGSYLFLASRYFACLGNSGMFYFLYLKQEEMAAILGTRVYAIWNGNKRVLAFILLFVVGGISAAIWAIGIPSKDPGTRCEFGLTDSVAQRQAVPWEAVIAYDSLLFVLTILRSSQVLVDDGVRISVPLLELILRDGAIYFFAMVLVTTANVVTFYVLKSLSVTGRALDDGIDYFNNSELTTYY